MPPTPVYRRSARSESEEVGNSLWDFVHALRWRGRVEPGTSGAPIAEAMGDYGERKQPYNPS